MHFNSATIISLYFLIHLIFSFDKKPLSDMSMAGLCSNLVNLIMIKVMFYIIFKFSHSSPDFFIKFVFVFSPHWHRKMKKLTWFKATVVPFLPSRCLKMLMCRSGESRPFSWHIPANPLMKTLLDTLLAFRPLKLVQPWMPSGFFAVLTVLMV